MVKGAAIKGLSKILRKGTKAKRPRGTPTKAGLVARRNMLRGKPVGAASQIRSPIPSGTKKKTLIGKTEKGIGIGVAGTLAYQEIKKGQKAAKAKEDKKLKKKSTHHFEKSKKKQKEYRRDKKYKN